MTSTSSVHNNNLNHNGNMKHALVIPVALQAHVAGIHRFALQLARRGVTVTFVTMASDIPKMKAYEELQGLDFNLISYSPSLTPPSSAAKFSDIKDLIASTGVQFSPILEDLKARQNVGLPGPTCIVYDRFCTWAADVAEQLNLPLYTFYSCGAILTRYLQEAPRLLSEEGPLRVKEDGTLQEFDGCLNIAGLPPLMMADLPRSVRPHPQLAVSIGKAMERAAVVIVNTFYELEYPQIDAIERRLEEQAFTSGKKKTELFLVGPLSNIATFKDLSFTRVGAKPGLDTEGVESLQWLQNQPYQSVLFICMGSMNIWNPQQVYELALALEASEQRFLWVLPTGPHLPSLDAVLPTGFEQRMRRIGLIATGWVPQLQILTHPAVSSFLTHCGWNSLIESISSGVPLIYWPQRAEQHLNRRYFLDVLKIGVDVGPREVDSSLVSHEKFEKAFRLLMLEGEGKAIRSRVQALMLKARAAVTGGGPSSRALDELTKRIPGNYTSIPP
ncbi:hypothetical protein R1flu_011786 [Riccia fluitans]|uniref:Glycosyltransferase n=1 Tax=Riccia fluitans TaxID=41844 RepID=A0ABD1Z9Y4_9MARC